MFKRMKKILLSALAMLTMLLSACSDQSDYVPDDSTIASSDRLLVVCEGVWGNDDATISYIDSTGVINEWFRKQNPGMKLGDTANDILQINDTLIAISVNSSNIIQYIHPDGTAIAATEDIPNNRKLATDGRYLYVTSYANNGYVAKIDLRTKQILDTCATGYEPEGIACYDGKLFIANTGGYAYQKIHDYEQTISVVDATTMRELRRIDTGCINLYGKLSQSGRYLCINSAGDYYNVTPKTVVLDMATEKVTTFDFPATYNCTIDGLFYVIGSAFSYVTYTYTFSWHVIDPATGQDTEGLGRYNAATTTIAGMDSPYGIYISPVTRHLYVSDARGYTVNGRIYEFDTDGTLLRKIDLEGLNPSSYLALPKK